MKIVFLDIDGVLATPSSYKTICYVNGNTYNSFDAEAVANLNTVLEATGAFIVISSTWRKIYTFMELKEILAAQGVKGKVLSTTGTHMHGRGQEIKDWLDTERKVVDAYAIIDDDVFDIMDLHPQNTVHVKGGWSGGRGMLSTDADKCIAILGKHVSKDDALCK